MRRRTVSPGHSLAIGLLAVTLATLCCAPGCQVVAPFLSTATPTATATLTATPTATATATSTPTRTPTLTPTLEPLSLLVNLTPAQVQNGRTALIEIESNRPVTVTGSFRDRPLAFAQTTTSSWALAGVPVTAQAGVYPVQLSITDTLGTHVSTTTTLTVVRSDYGSEVIVIPESRVVLMSPEVLSQESQRLTPVFATTSAMPLWQGVFIWPYEGRMTTPFGMRRTYNDGRQGFHAGVDLAGDAGVPIVVAAAGVVLLAEPLQTHGNAVVVDHGLGVLTAYYHLDQILASQGQQVAQGQVVGTLGNTGLSTGPHLHWEMRVGDVPVDPLEWLDRRFPR